MLPKSECEIQTIFMINKSTRAVLLTKAKVKVAYIFSIRSIFTFNVNDDDTHVWRQMRSVEPFQKSSSFFGLLFNFSFEFLMPMVIQLMLVFDLIWFSLRSFCFEFLCFAFALLNFKPFDVLFMFCTLYIHFAVCFCFCLSFRLWSLSFVSHYYV